MTSGRLAQALLASFPDAVLRIGRDMVIRDVLSGSRIPGLEQALAADVASSTVPDSLAVLLVAGVRKAFQERHEQAVEFVWAGRDCEARIVVSDETEALVVIRDITRRKRAERSLHFVHTLTVEIASAAGLRSAGERTLALFGTAGGFDYAEAWTRGPAGRLEVTATWVRDPARFAGRPDASRPSGFSLGREIAAQVWPSGAGQSGGGNTPVWFTDLGAGGAPVPPHLPPGLTTCLAMPVADRDPVATLLFFGPRRAGEILPVDDLAAVTANLGWMLRQKQLQDNHGLLTAVLEQTHDAVGVVAAGTPDLPLVFVNSALCRMTGFEPHELLGKSPSLLVRDAMLTRKDGSTVDAELVLDAVRDRAGQVTHVVGIARDVSEKSVASKAQQELEGKVFRASREWRTTFDAIDFPILLVNPDRTVARLNRTASSLCGMEPPDCLGRPVDALGRGQPWALIHDLVGAVHESRRSASAQGRDPAEQRTWDVAVSPVFLFDQAGRDEERLLVVARDVTDIVKMHESMRQAERLSAMGSLVAGVAHEVRNPLFGISATLDAFEARFGGRAEHAPHITVLKKEVGRLSELMSGLLEYGRPPHLEVSLGAVCHVIRRAHDLCLPLAGEARVSVEMDVPEDLPQVFIDGPRLFQVFRNVIENAIQHAGARGRIAVLARACEEKGRPFIACEVHDSGPGFHPDDIPHVFEPFFTRRKGGTGLGLAIVERIVGQHGGTVSARNHRDGGAVVTVVLPAEKEAAGDE